MTTTTEELLLLQARKSIKDDGILSVDLMVELQLHGFSPDNVIAMMTADEVEMPLEEAYHRIYTNPDLHSKRLLSQVTEDKEVDFYVPAMSPETGLGATIN